ncbi:MAG: AbrB/MazE/SpoVT family DNA-binding domain-containing protein [Candidatus Dormibacteria bacterium]
MAHAADNAHADRAVLPIGERGRVVIPARIRRSLGVEPGDDLFAEVQPDHSLRLVPRHVLARRDRGAFADLRSNASVVDELIRERREEAAREAPKP